VGSGIRRSTDIDATNVSRLQPVWQWKHWETRLEDHGTTPGQFEATPLMIDGVLYVTTPYNSIAALDAETGRELWRFDGAAYELGQLLSGSGWKLRGTAVWRDDRGRLRLLLNSRHRLFMLDAATGKPVTEFGNGGAVPLNQGLPRMGDITHMSQSSPPVVYRNLVIVGSQVPDRVQLPDPLGWVQAFDARTGRRVWAFSTIPQSEKDAGAETWENGSWRANGHANVWAPMALDEARGLLYLPTSTPTSDYYGGQRPGANLFAESLVCLDAATGKMKWHFQTVHHGLVGLGSADAAQSDFDHGRWHTHRRGGAGDQARRHVRLRPCDRCPGVADRRTPGADRDRRAGEQPFPTQPFPTKPPSFVPQGVSLDDANNLTPEINRLARERMQKVPHRTDVHAAIAHGHAATPVADGGANWGGAAFDPSTGYLLVRGKNDVGVNRVGKNDGSNPLVKVDYSNVFSGGGESAALPGGLPLVAPPYAVLAAIDLNKGDIAWRVPLGEGSQTVRNHPLLEGVTLPERLGSPGNLRRSHDHPERARLRRRRGRLSVCSSTSGPGASCGVAQCPISSPRTP
jgi:quinoprotein glucose dehydrogenase